MTQGIQEQVGIFSAIEPEGHFFAVGLEMLCADFMPSSQDAALQKREGGFDSVGMNIALYVDVEFVPDGFVPSVLTEMLRGASVGVEVIGKENFDIFTDILADVLFERAAFHVRRMEKAQIPAALPDADYVLFVVPSGLFSFASIDAADKGFVHFDFAVQHRPLAFHHRGADSVTQVPSRFVADSKRPLNLTGAHALLCLAEQVGCREPLFQRQVSVIENRPSCYGELIAA